MSLDESLWVKWWDKQISKLRIWVYTFLFIWIQILLFCYNVLTSDWYIQCIYWHWCPWRTDYSNNAWHSFNRNSCASWPGNELVGHLHQQAFFFKDTADCIKSCTCQLSLQQWVSVQIWFTGQWRLLCKSLYIGCVADSWSDVACVLLDLSIPPHVMSV